MPELNNTILKNNANLKAYYRMESGALTTDSSGNGYTLTNTNTVADGTGKFGGAADFGATNSNKWLNLNDDYGINGGVISISIWIKLAAFPASGNVYFPIFISDDGTDTAFQIVFYNNGTSRLISFHRIRNGVGQEGVAYFAFDPGTEWHHYVLTYDSTNVRGYIDGAIRGTGAASGNGTTALAQLTGIGANMDGGYLSGLIDDVAIFNTPLSADQIKELYEGRYVGEGMPETSLVGGWHFNGNLTDFSGNNYHLTAANAPTDVAGKFNGAKKFVRASTQSVSIADASCPALEINGSQTWYFWLYPTTIGATNMCLSKTAGGVLRQMYVNSSNQVTFDVGSTTPGTMATDITLAANTWYQIVGVVDSVAGTISIYINAKGKSVSYTGSPGDTNAPFYIGRDAAGNYLDGIIDEVRIYNVAKDANWVRKQYAWSVGKFL